MSGLPIGVYTGAVGISAVVALAAGVYLVINARRLARLTETPDNDMLSGPRARGAPRGTLGVRIAGLVCAAATCVAIGILVLVATGVIGSKPASHDPTVQRP